MKITVTGSLGNISRPLVKNLLANGHEVKVISSNAGRATEIEELQAIPSIGSVEDPEFVKNAFRGSDAVYLMIPPNFSAPDYKAFTIRVGQNYANAIKDTGITHIVNLSSSGSPLAGTPPLAHYQNLEVWLDGLQNINVMHLRPGGFYSNFYGSIPMIKQQGIIGNNFPADTHLVMSHPLDIADAAAEALNTRFEGKNIQYIISDRKNGGEIARILGTAIGKNLNWIQFSDEQMLGALLQNGFSKDAAQHYIVDMGVAIREGVLEKHYSQNSHRVSGKRSFAEFAEEFAKVCIILLP